MKIKLCMFFILICSGALSNCLTDDQIKSKIDLFVQNVMECWETPGLTLSVVRDGKLFLSKGYGLANLDEEKPFTNKTMVVIASDTKAFVGVLLAKLISESPNITWDTPVRDILGDWFYLADAYRTQHLTLRDLIGHRAGYPRHDVVRVQTFNLRELMERLRFFEPIYEVRTRYRYNNLMYGLASYVAEVIGGKSWEELTDAKIFKPLNMTSSTFVHLARDRWGEFATPYRTLPSGDLRPVSLDVYASIYGTVGAAGGIGSNSEDMAKWVSFHMNGGKNEDGVQVINSTVLEETYTSLTAISADGLISKPIYPVTFVHNKYGYGWKVGYYRGYKNLMHYGGQSSIVSILREKKLGVYITENRSSRTVLNNINMYIMDLLLGVEPWLNETSACSSFLQEDLNLYSNNQYQDVSFNQQEDSFEDTEDYTDVQEDFFSYSLEDSLMYTKNTNEESRYHLINQENVYNDFDAKAPTDVVGIYGNYGYGNLTVYINDTTGQLMMSYGLTAFWQLEETLDEFSYIGLGQEPFWFWNLASVEFSSSDGLVYDAVDVSFDNDDPPRFTRDLKLSSAPSPPKLCNKLNNY